MVSSHFFTSPHSAGTIFDHRGRHNMKTWCKPYFPFLGLKQKTIVVQKYISRPCLPYFSVRRIIPWWPVNRHCHVSSIHVRIPCEAIDRVRLFSRDLHQIWQSHILLQISILSHRTLQVSQSFDVRQHGICHLYFDYTVIKIQCRMTRIERYSCNHK